MRYAIALAILAGLVGLVLVVGWSLPVRHTATRKVLLPVSATHLWELMIDFPSYHTWRSGIVAVQRLEDVNGHAVWKEVEKGGDGLAYETVATQPGERLVRRIVGKGLPFGGTWTFQLQPRPEGTELVLTEDGEIYNPVFRFVSRFFMGYQRSMQVYLDDLARHLQVPAVSQAA